MSYHVKGVRYISVRRWLWIGMSVMLLLSGGLGLSGMLLDLDDLIVCVIRPEYGPMVDNKLTVHAFCEEFR